MKKSKHYKNWKPATTTPPEGVDFKIGDNVTYTNEYGVAFAGLKVIGFNDGDCNLWQYGHRVYLDFDCYWFPVHPDRLIKVGKQ